MDKFTLLKGYDKKIEKIRYHILEIQKMLDKLEETKHDDKQYLKRELFSLACNCIHYIKE